MIGLPSTSVWESVQGGDAICKVSFSLHCRRKALKPVVHFTLSWDVYCQAMPILSCPHSLFCCVALFLWFLGVHLVVLHISTSCHTSEGLLKYRSLSEESFYTPKLCYAMPLMATLLCVQISDCISTLIQHFMVYPALLWFFSLLLSGLLTNAQLLEDSDMFPVCWPL